MLMLLSPASRYVAERSSSYEAGKLVKVLESSKIYKARLLHYFPPPASATASVSDSASAADQDKDQGELDHNQAWCGWHTDHGSITGVFKSLLRDK